MLHRFDAIVGQFGAAIDFVRAAYDNFTTPHHSVLFGTLLFLAAYSTGCLSTGQSSDVLLLVVAPPLSRYLSSSHCSIV